MAMTSTAGMALYDNTTMGSQESGHILPDLPVLGLPGWNFYILHYTAVISLTISIVSSMTVFYILKPSLRFPSFWNRTSGERFAIYLALGDLFLSISHICDHSYMLVTKDHPPDDACIAMAFFVATFTIVQSFMVSFMAFNAFMLVVKGWKVSLGKYDWRFVVSTIFVPMAIVAPCAALRWLGPSGGWCVFDARKETGHLFSYILSVFMATTMFINIFSYSFVWIKIKQVTKETRMVGDSTRGSNSRAASVMMKFVAAYIFQWSPTVVYHFWSLAAVPPFAAAHVVVFLCNIGGLFNLIAYTTGRNMGKGKQEGKQGIKKNDNTSSATTLSTVSG